MALFLLRFFLILIQIRFALIPFAFARLSEKRKRRKNLCKCWKRSPDWDNRDQLCFTTLTPFRFTVVISVRFRLLSYCLWFTLLESQLDLRFCVLSSTFTVVIVVSVRFLRLKSQFSTSNSLSDLLLSFVDAVAISKSTHRLILDDTSFPFHLWLCNCGVLLPASPEMEKLPSYI